MCVQLFPVLMISAFCTRQVSGRASGTPYAVQLFTKSAELRYFKACYPLDDLYEHEKLNRSRDPTLSIPSYTSAALNKHPRAMIPLCAWYIVEAEFVIEKTYDEVHE